MLAGLSVALLVIVAMCAGFPEERGRPVLDRAHRSEVRADCRAWLLAWVDDVEVIARIGRFKPGRTRDLACLEDQLDEFGVGGGTWSLRWKRIAMRRREAPLAEHEVVEEFICAARDLARGEGLGC